MSRIPCPLFLGIVILCTTFMPAHSQEIVFKNSQPRSSLIELYSSEGCSSCPPADSWINNLGSAPGLWKDVFPVVFHVDYWDGLGWPDRFARANYTQRQRDYAQRLGQDSVYTPEFIVNGAEWRRSWLSGQTLPANGAEKIGELSLTANTKEGKLTATYQLNGAANDRSLTLNVAVLGQGLVVDVQRGENGGRKLTHDFVVLGFSSTALSAKSDSVFGSGPVEMKSTTGDAPAAVVAWVSRRDGTILQVAGGWLRATSSN